jgi:hypothetical protein
MAGIMLYPCIIPYTFIIVYGLSERYTGVIFAIRIQWYTMQQIATGKEIVTVTKSEWKTIGVRIKAKDLPLFNRRLSLYGFETLGSLVADFLTGKFPVITEDRQIQTLDSNIQGNGMKTALDGQFEPTFYKNIDLDDMLNYLLNIRKFQGQTFGSWYDDIRYDT